MTSQGGQGPEVLFFTRLHECVEVEELLAFLLAKALSSGT